MNAELVQLAAAGTAAAGVAGWVKGWYFAGDRNSPQVQRQRERDRSPAWARPADLPDLLVPGAVAGRVQLGTLGGRVVANPPRRSALVQAPTGGGKTPRVAVPAVLRHSGPAVVASVKSDVLHLTRAHRYASGPLWVFDPTRAAGLPTARWSPLLGITTYADAMSAAMWLADSSKVEARGLEDARFWDTLGQKLLAPLLFAAARTGRHISDVCTWVDVRGEEDVAAILATLGDRDAIAAWAASRSRAERTKASVYGTAEVILHPFAHPAVRDALSPAHGEDRTLDVDALLDLDGTLYLVAPASDQELFTPVFETLVNAVLRQVERRSAATGLPLDPPLLLLLDEAANIAPLRRLDRVASAGANQGVCTVSVWQDEGQLVATYGPHRARTVLSNHTARMYLSGISDEQTLRALSAAIGDHQVRRVTDSRDANTGRRSRSATPHDEPVAPVDWLRRLPPGEAIVLTGQHKPMRLQVPGWYEDPQLRALVEPQVATTFDRMFAG